MRILVTAATKHGATGEIARAIVSALRVPDGDFRDWAGISSWAAGIATALRSPSPGTLGSEGHAHQ